MKTGKLMDGEDLIRAREFFSCLREERKVLLRNTRIVQKYNDCKIVKTKHVPSLAGIHDHQIKRSLLLARYCAILC